MLKFIGRRHKLLQEPYYATHLSYIFTANVYLYNDSCLLLTNRNICWCSICNGLKCAHLKEDLGSVRGLRRPGPRPG